MSVTTEKKNFTQELIASFDLSKFKQDSEQRKKALAAFQSLGLPEGKSEEYKFTPITKLLAKQFKAEELYTSPTPAVSDVSALIPKAFQENCVVFVNGVYNPALSQLAAGSKVVIKPFQEAMATHASVISEKLNEIKDNNDPFALLNAAMWQDGLFIHVPKNTSGEKPLFIYHLHDANASKVTSHTRLMVVVEQSAEFSIVERTDSLGKNTIFNTINEEILVDENASFSYCKIQNDSGDLIHVSNTTVHQKKSSRADTYTFSLDGKLIRNNLNIIIDGEGCESHFYGLYLTDGDTLVDNHTVVDHKQPNSFSNELYKGLMDGKSKGVFNGKIFVRPHAQKTNAFQSNRNILLSDDATINTKPQLEIWADDVKCSHGCTTGQLDDEALFYLQSRGIPKATAKAMLLYAFAGEVLEAIKDENLKQYIDSIVSERLHKSF
ncbi:MAG TPA: Fe-S cluster assembly protein SufD [Cytophagales bacterium]|nr:Fe-S cluster assembly protein SufD [Cytophagales bacterium]